ncbi:hypothetical protein [Krasilnikovia sp. M28-CT-15]|uniref:hypothetical protein n=1 Tax=Krasilnikovia sp. M28-CT-15 TaxID=3373540 RepID=UPI003876B3BB
MPHQNDDPVPPKLEPDTPAQQISAEPQPAEYGAHTFGRLITTRLGWMLGTRITPPLYRGNPFDHRPCPRAQTYTLTVGYRSVLVTAFEHTPTGLRDSLPAYAISIDGERVPFRLAGYRHVEWQIARTIWLALNNSTSAGGAG